MRLFIAVIICMFINTFLIFAGGGSLWVTAEPGLRMREAPNEKAKKIVTIPYGEEVIFIEETGDEITVSGATGRWTRIEWNGKTGWVFGGFLSDNDQASEGYIPDESDIYGDWMEYSDDGLYCQDFGYTFNMDYTVEFYGEEGVKGTWDFENMTIYMIMDYYWQHDESGPHHCKDMVRLVILEFNDDSMLVKRLFENSQEGLSILLKKVF